MGRKRDKPRGRGRQKGAQDAEPLPTEDVGLIVLKSASGGASSWFSGEYNANGAHPVDGAFNYGTPDYYIGLAGTHGASDSNDGLTPSTPKTIAWLNSGGATYGGKVIGILDGTYGLYDILGLPSSGGFDTGRLLVTGGSAGSPTVLVSQTARGAIIDGQRQIIWDIPNTVDWQRALLKPNGDYIVIDGLEFTGANYRCITNYSGGDFCTLRNCLFSDQDYLTGSAQGANSAHVYAFNVTDMTIQNCRFIEGSASSDNWRHACIEYSAGGGLGVVRGTVEYSSVIIASNGSNGVHYKNPNANEDGVIRYNHIDMSGAVSPANGGCIQYNGDSVTTDTATINNNVMVTTNGRPCIWNTGMAGTYSIYRNTFAGDWGSNIGCLALMHTGPPLAIDFYENISAPSTAGGKYGEFHVDDEVNDLGTMDNNMYPSGSIKMTSGGATPTNSWTTLASWRTASSRDANSTQDDPEFVATGTEADYYKLGPTSPAKTAAADSGEIGAWRGTDQVGADF